MFQAFVDEDGVGEALSLVGFTSVMMQTLTGTCD